MSWIRNLAAIVNDWITPQGGTLVCGRCNTRHKGWKALDSHIETVHTEVLAQECAA